MVNFGQKSGYLNYRNWCVYLIDSLNKFCWLSYPGLAWVRCPYTTQSTMVKKLTFWSNIVEWCWFLRFPRIIFRVCFSRSIEIQKQLQIIYCQSVSSVNYFHPKEQSISWFSTPLIEKKWILIIQVIFGIKLRVGFVYKLSLFRWGWFLETIGK